MTRPIPGCPFALLSTRTAMLDQKSELYALWSEEAARPLAAPESSVPAITLTSSGAFAFIASMGPSPIFKGPVCCFWSISKGEEMLRLEHRFPGYVYLMMHATDFEQTAMFQESKREWQQFYTDASNKAAVRAKLPSPRERANLLFQDLP